jgi:hypothetical protein
LTSTSALFRATHTKGRDIMCWTRPTLLRKIWQEYVLALLLGYIIYTEFIFSTWRTSKINLWFAQTLIKSQGVIFALDAVSAPNTLTHTFISIAFNLCACSKPFAGSHSRAASSQNKLAF